MSEGISHVDGTAVGYGGEFKVKPPPLRPLPEEIRNREVVGESGVRHSSAELEATRLQQEEQEAKSERGDKEVLQDILNILNLPPGDRADFGYMAIKHLAGKIKSEEIRSVLQKPFEPENQRNFSRNDLAYEIQEAIKKLEKKKLLN